MADEWWTKQQACRHLGITIQTLNEYVRDGLTQYQPDPRSRTKYVRREDVQAEYRRRKLAQKDTRGPRSDTPQR
jgi:predicted site-specific integrase-resolvase